ncbi:putative hybrid NRPS/PKS enzyme [Aspergillus sclerotioniger CBS 115572]|uniref:Putative hybrid NRPS/PKS enzyme n=1 Tax=Aspergillus sclerotioniger CBS 115572 TaxID=1450535 RepID=A0A317VNX1_9EURO|nr:putative hybrid NRPS/PKS enzyme [Aspergillus sclerotioniger CBS 115572]PWY76064.1 putative hybrid NRPS/PKS enzyme [Aspergillus sclerotioniger CBS 115572]
MAGSQTHSNEPIAIIGSGCRFPGAASTPSKLWDLLREPRDVQSRIPDTRFNPDGFYHPENTHHGTSNVRHSYFLSEDHRHFDAQFFGIKPVEAHSIDPQQRLLLETVYESIEAAGISIDHLQGSQTAVYVGLMGADYADLLGRDTSLIAVHQAVQVLRSGESRMAIAAGANLLLGPEQYIAESNLKMLSPDGRSYMWDERANGYARGEGMASVVLKTLSSAIADGDHIECIIRETGINQDGKTKGITMPSPTAQAALIETTYAKAGLDLHRAQDRPQYFEAHGTGTPAGDPTEAEAIHNAFFMNNGLNLESHSPLFVGSIKTVIGHTEGTAGLAGLLKASLALQHGVIPPNLLFERLAPSVRPFYQNLEIATKSQPWPSTNHNAPRRASVNSFGFGGANAHCILESYEPSQKPFDPNRHTEKSIVCTPFTFSAASESSLRGLVSSYSNFLKARPSTDLRALSLTLATRRSAFSTRVSFSATDVLGLASKLDFFKTGNGEKSIAASTSASREGPFRVLGVFTGQGAQWARMGAELLRFPAAHVIVDRLEESLAHLPLDRPKWSLKRELLADKTSSRVGEAALSQPLCTAIQIILVDLLKAAGIKFSAVVGHSSGEIGAAYAAGYITATDAIRIAYYRGANLHFAQGKQGQAGAMIAVGTSYEDAQKLCKLRRFRGKVCVAASNSATSVTISGDTDAIDNVRAVYEEEQKFARVLKVDKAYHSHHMVPCSEAYANSLRACGIQPRRPLDSDCIWISSVYQQHIDDVKDNLADSYWISNLVSPVLFSQALEYALGESQFDLVIEVGPHPALKGPASQVIQDVLGAAIPYTGVLRRGVNDIDSLSTGLGYIWANLGPQAVDCTGYDGLLNPDADTQVPLKGLPPYSWDHDRPYWYESRISKIFRERKYLPHELLGTRCPNSSDKEVRWNNYLIPKELPWITGHQIQGQMVFPAAGYMSTAFEAVREIAGEESLRSIELKDFTIGQPLVFDAEDSSVEILVSLTQVERHGDTLTGRFSFFSTAGQDSGPMSLNADGVLEVTFGDPVLELLPPMPAPQFAMMAVETDRFYDTFAGYGYEYTGPFRALSSMERKSGIATGLISVPESSVRDKPLLIHPAALDAAIQSILLAFCFPGDGRLQSIQLPTDIARISINPAICAANSAPGLSLKFLSTIGRDDGARVDGDVDLYAADGQNAMIQLEGMHTRPMVPPTESTDTHIFSEPVWDVASPNAMQTPWNERERFEFGFVLERVAYYYLRHLVNRTTEKDRGSCEWHHKHLFAYADYMLDRVSRGHHPFAQQQWITDTHDEITSIIESYPDSIDLRIMRAVGENIISAIRGESTMLEAMMKDNMLNEFYVTGLGMEEYLKRLTTAVKQIGHRHPTMNVLEIGAGTGGATKSILRELDDAFASYTFTDISSGFFEKAMQTFKAYESKMTFKTLDIEKDVLDQGYADHSFDLIIASLVLHATTKLEETMKNVRQLLKPGGYLVMLEITDNDPMRFGFIFGGLPGWWLGTDDGRPLSPCIEPSQWENLLEDTGFSGIESIAPHHSTEPLPLCVILSQAVDDRLNLLRDPLSPVSQGTIAIPGLTIIGGSKAHTSHLISSVAQYLTPFCGQIRRFASLSDLDATSLSSSGSVICLQDHDDPVLRSLSESKLRGLQLLFERSKNVLWVTAGYKECDPYAKMIVGLCRCLLQEMQHLRLQVLDFPATEEPSSKLVSEAMIRLAATEIWDEEGRLKDLFWSTEPEIAYEQGKALIPRVRLSKRLNSRYNSSRRLITQAVDIKSESVTLTYSGNTYSLLSASDQAPENLIQSASYGTVEVDVSYSLSRSVKIGQLGHFFVVLGTNRATGLQVLSLSTTLSSRITVPESWVQPCLLPAQQAVDYLVTVFHGLLCNAALSDLVRGDILAVLEPSETLAKLLEPAGLRRGISILFLTSTIPPPRGPWTAIHPRSSRRDVNIAIPQNVARLLTWTDSTCSNLIQYIASSHPVETRDTLTQFDGRLNTASSDHRIPEAFQSCLLQLRSNLFQTNRQDVPIRSLQELVNGQFEQTGTIAVVDWRSETTVPLRLQPVDSRPLFRTDRTYWLVGLTGGLGLSLCRWMITRGAKYIALSSRNPKVDPRWISEFQALGATVKVYANDVTDRQSVHSVYQQIVASLPPVAGVCQGAMVLHDTLFLDLTMERMEKVLKPKVDGAVHLDEIFSREALDFFVFLSSMASVTGNPGQAAYAAANMFLAGLAAQRRRRGLAASTVHIGAIVGNGYVTRELTLAQQVALQKVGNMWMSEQDFYQIFAEAVVASPPRPGPNPEYFTGLRVFYNDEEDKPQYAENPIFSHLIKHRHLEGSITHGNSATVPVKIQLSKATTHEEVYEIMRAALVAKLQSALQTPADLDMMNLNADALGIDSLVALDLRSWFLKELKVDIPVLKIISGSTMGELLGRAGELLSANMIPNVVAGAVPDRNPVSSEKAQTKPAASALSATLRQQPKPTQSAPAPPSIVETTRQEPKEKPVTTANHTPFSVAKKEEKKKIERRVIPAALSVPDVKPDPLDDRPQEGMGWSSTSQSEPQSPSSAKATPSEMSGSSFEDIPQPIGTDNAVQRILPVSFSQSRFWFLRSYLEDKTTFNVTVSIRLQGKLRVDDLAQAVATVGQRHESLRTRFFTDQSHEPMQAILESSVLRLEKKTICNIQEAQAEYLRLKNHEYDLENGETMRIILLCVSATVHELILGYHHINMDGVAFEIFFSDLQKAYDGTLPANSGLLQYPDFASRQKKQYLDGEWRGELAYWRKEFQTIPAPLPIIPLSNSTGRVTLGKYATHLASYRLSPTLSTRIYDTCKRLKVSPFQFYLAVYRVTISRFVDVESLCIGVSDANRNDSDVQQSLGCYLNLLPVRFETPGALSSFSETVRDTKSKAQQAFANSKVPFDVLLNELNVPRSSNHSPLFQVLLNYRQGVAESRTFCDCACEWTNFDGGQTAYDLNLDIVDNAGGDALLRLSVQKALYAALDGEIILKCFVNLVDAFSQNPAMRLNKPALYSKEDSAKAIALGRGLSTPLTWQGTLMHRIDEVVVSSAQGLAIKDGLGHALTYGQMSDRTNAIAQALSDAGVRDRSKVAVFQEPSADVICSLLAILRLGAVYIPLDPRVTTNRLAVILKACQPTAILTDAKTHDDITSLSFDTKLLDVSRDIVPATARKPLVPNVSTEDSVMAILYTSGSTGIPKGVVMKHSVFRNHVETVHNAWISGLTAVRGLQQSSFSFDMSLVQIFWPLCSGGSVYVVPQSARGDPLALSHIISSERISVTAATPTEYISWSNFGNQDALRQSEWKLCISGGERMTPSLTEAFRHVSNPGLRLINCYGPTETTFFSHFAEVEWQTVDPTNISLAPWTNYSTYILDSNLEPLPMGVPGEVAVGGMGVASGYHNQKEATQQRFIPDRFAPEEWIHRGWGVMHTTGDRGRLQQDGTLLLEGRIAGDTQIKLRGLRIDLQDIEATIVQTSKGRIVHAVVSRRENSDFLVAHVQLLPEGNKSADEFLNQLLVDLPLPQYMRPALIIPTETLPRTASGKIDRLAVQLVPLPRTPQKEPENTSHTVDDMESLLLKLWEEVLTPETLGHFTVDSNSDFFRVGGSSLLLMRLQALIKAEFSIDLPFAQLFDASTLGGMAARIQSLLRLDEHIAPVDAILGEADVPQNPVPEVMIDWDTETSTPSGIPSSTILGSNKPRVAILTGATGFLGKALLRQLLSTPSIEKVYCIAVRATASHSDPVFSSPKVAIYHGDQSLPSLGLSPSDIDMIFSVADTIIHNGADVSFLKSYPSLRNVNVESTKQLATWALLHGLQFHYISTASITSLSGQEAFPCVSLRDFPPAVDGSNGYIASKWASEVYLEQISTIYGMPLVIHRPSSITGPGASETDVMGSLLKYSKMLHAIPRAEYIRGFFDFISVDRAATEIVAAIQAGINDVDVKYVFESGELQIESREMKSRMEKLTGETILELTMEEWVRRAEVLGLNPMVAAFLQGAAGQGVLMTQLIKDV